MIVGSNTNFDVSTTLPANATIATLNVNANGSLLAIKGSSIYELACGNGIITARTSIPTGLSYRIHGSLAITS